LIAIGVEA
jgi:hypothetical protein